MFRRRAQAAKIRNKYALAGGLRIYDAQLAMQKTAGRHGRPGRVRPGPQGMGAQGQGGPIGPDGVEISTIPPAKIKGQLSMDVKSGAVRARSEVGILSLTAPCNAPPAGRRLSRSFSP